MHRTTHADHDGSLAELQELDEMLSDSYASCMWLHNWSSSRLWDWRFGGNAIRHRDDLSFFRRNLHIWRSEGRPAGFLISERGMDLSLQVHPDHRDLEDEMLDWAEKEWSAAPRALETSVWGTDSWCQRLLSERGWKDAESAGFMRRYDTWMKVPDAPLPEGFRLTTMAEEGSVREFVEAVIGAFKHPGLGMEWFESKRSAPDYRDEWLIMAMSPEGRCASFCDARMDRERAYTEIDPVGTHPDFQRMGIAKACLAECLRRLREAGVRNAFIGSDVEPNPSNRLYDSLHPVEKREGRVWRKE
jgi:ribosomal protein S18 acetylase RimI-like enzyme